MSFFGKPRGQRELLSGRKLRERALDLLSRRDHSQRELFNKLREKGGVLEELEPLLEDLKEMGYLDDSRYAENFVRFRSGKAWGQRRYQQELRQRGVDSEVVDSVLSRLPELEPDFIADKLQKLVERELDKGREERKILSSFLRRGFTIGSIKDVLAKAKSTE